MDKENALVVFQDKSIRRLWNQEEWWFVLEDIIVALTDSTDPKQYISKLRQRDEVLSQGWVQIVHPLPIPTIGGIQNMNCANAKGLFRIIQSIPSPKAEPFKLWLAKTGYQRVQEIQNPELIQKRMVETYKQKGYSDAWIEKRIRGIIIRDELTAEWKNKGVEENKDFSILTAEISKATFDMTPKEYKKFKGLKNENLRDHMDDMELIFTMLGEGVTKELTAKENSEDFKKLKAVAKKGGASAGNARKEIEKGLGRNISTKDNYLTIPEKQKRLSLKSKNKRKIKYK